MGILKENGKNVYEFTGIISNPTYSKVQEGAKIAKENNVDFILAVIHPKLYRHIYKEN